MAHTVQYRILNVTSGVDTGYAIDQTSPVIYIGSPVPISKQHESLIVVPITATDNYKIGTSGVSLFSTAGSISNLTQVDDQTVTFNILVSATTDIGISAVDVAGNSTFTIDTDYVIDGNADVTPPIITFFNYDPDTKFIINRGPLVDSTSGIRHETTGAVRVRVYDPDGSIAPVIQNVVLTSGSIGEIDQKSFLQTNSPDTIEFLVQNISATGNVIVSARDDSGNSVVTSSDQFIIGCNDNDRLVNLVDFLPSHLKENSTNEFVKFFENFLNTMYTQSDDPCNISILKKIERIATLHDPNAIDIEYIQFFANNMGYNVDLTRGDLGLFTVSAADPTDVDDIERQNNSLRFVVENLPNWYRIKTTRNAVKIMLYSFGIVGDIFYQYSNDYNANWITYKDETENISSAIPVNYYPTTHFTILIDLGQTQPQWVSNVDKVIQAINSIRPINTVFDNLTAFLKVNTSSNSSGITLTIKTKNNLYMAANWTGDTGTYVAEGGGGA